MLHVKLHNPFKNTLCEFGNILSHFKYPMKELEVIPSPIINVSVESRENAGIVRISDPLFVVYIFTIIKFGVRTGLVIVMISSWNEFTIYKYYCFRIEE